MGKNDPYSPGYVPRYQGEDDRDVGDGDAFALDTGRLYIAGLEHFPVTAGVYAEAATDLFYVEGALKSIFETAGRYPVFTVAQHAERMYEVLAVTSQRLYDAGDALVRIANDFVGTDEGVEREMDRLTQKNRDILVDPPPRPSAPSPDDDYREVLAVGPPGPHRTLDIPDEAETDENLENLNYQDYLDQQTEADDGVDR